MITAAQGFLKRPRFATGQYILLVSAYLTIANNGGLFKDLGNRLDIFSPEGMAYAFAAYVAMTMGAALLLAIFGLGGLLKPVAIVLVMLSAVLGYFTNQLGVVFGVDMIRNISETIVDHNLNEGMELMSWPLVQYAMLWGVLPSIFFAISRVTQSGLIRDGVARLAIVSGLLLVVLLLVFPNYKFVSYFSRENREIQAQFVPLNALVSLWKYCRPELSEELFEFKLVAEDAHREKCSPIRTVGVMVVGETARSDHFSLNSYGRPTNPRLSKRDLLNFSNVTSSGTSTAYSVPCMFSFLNKANYSPDKAKKQSNVLDALDGVGVKVSWTDNNSSSKGVCDRIGYVSIRDGGALSLAQKVEGEVFDEQLLVDLNRNIDSVQGDVLIVLHGMGSHGPAYHRRYPDAFEVFTPSCRQDAPQACSDRELINSYDNTIVYTDYILDQIIELLMARDPGEAKFLFYASDHGESLGENGMYLHGLPDMFAPSEQRRVPMILWLSSTYREAHDLDYAALLQSVDGEFSHDNISHTIMGLFDVKASVYDHSLDLVH